MKIAFYINKLSDGGAERVVANLANYLVEGNDVCIINSFRTDEEYFVNDKVVRLITDDVVFKNRLHKNRHRIKKLKTILKDYNFDVLVSFMAESNFRACLATKHTKTKLILSVRNDPKIEYKGFVGYLITRFLFRRGDGFVFQTLDAKSYFSNSINNIGRFISFFFCYG